MSGEKSSEMTDDIDSTLLDPPLDFSFKCLTCFADCFHEEPRDETKPFRLPGVINDDGSAIVKRNTNVVRFCNNVICDWKDFMSTMNTIVEDPEQIEWLDLSFNDLKTIDKSLLQFKNLKVLYLHGNCFEKLNDADKLSSLKNLKSLTLHGNPFEVHDGYRQNILSRLPQIMNFDFSGVTKSDRASSETLKQRNNSKRLNKV